MSLLWEFAPVILILALFLLITRVGSILLEMTGLDKPTAQFQALSALTGTGFTTRASEMVVGHEVRRRIVMVLMVIGNVGLVGSVAALISIFRHTGYQLNLIRLFLLLVLGVGALWLMNRRKFWRAWNERLELLIQKSRMFRKSTVEELLNVHGDYSVVEISVQEQDRNVGQKLRDTDFRARQILVLAIERGEKTLALPGPDEIIRQGDKLLCYGNLDSIADSIIQF